MTKRGKKLPRPRPTPSRPAAGDDEARPVFDPVPQDAMSGVSAFFGTWPGEETDAELLALLDEIDD
jgi:hypothetical protein